MVICNVAKILELVVPLMELPSETFLTTIEEDLMKLIIKYGMTVRFNNMDEKLVFWAYNIIISFVFFNNLKFLLDFLPYTITSDATKKTGFQDI